MILFLDSFSSKISALAKNGISNGYTGAELVAICRDAALRSIEDMDNGKIEDPIICMNHLIQSIGDMKPRTSVEMLQFYESFRGRH